MYSVINSIRLTEIGPAKLEYYELGLSWRLKRPIAPNGGIRYLIMEITYNVDRDLRAGLEYGLRFNHKGHEL